MQHPFADLTVTWAEGKRVPRPILSGNEANERTIVSAGFSKYARTDNFSYARFREKNKIVRRRTIIDSLVTGYPVEIIRSM